MQKVDEKPFLVQSTKKALNFQNHQSNLTGTEITFIWHVKNLKMCLDHSGKPLKSPEFSIYNWQSPTFQLLLYTGGFNKKCSQYISVYIAKTSYDEEDFTYSCKLGIVTRNDEKTCFEFNHSRLTRGDCKGLAEFFDKEKFQTSEDDIFLPDGNLTLFCKMKVSKRSLIYDFDFRLLELSEIYENIYKKEKHCDLFLLVEGKSFNAHKAILEARFPDLIKNIHGNECKIEGIGLKSMNALLRYIYTGFLNIGEINLFEIVSSKYVLPSYLKCLLLKKQNKTEVTTSFQTIEISFAWKIPNFNSLDSSKNIHYSLIGDYNLKWAWLNIFLSVTADDYVIISIGRFSHECKRIFCTIKTPDLSKTFDHTYDKENKWVLPKYFSKSMLKNTGTSTTSCEINLNFNIVVSDGSTISEIENKKLILKSDSSNQTASDLISFNKDLVNLLKDPKFCDITLISGKNKFPAHKFILSARSSIFSHMFKSDSGKKANFEIKIDDLNSSVIKDILAYIYCNEVEFSLYETKHIINMYTAASKYNLLGLQEECVNFLKSNISADTAGDILITAHIWNDEELKDLVYNYVCTHPVEIANSYEWEQVILKRSDLASEVLKWTLSYFTAKSNDMNIQNN